MAGEARRAWVAAPLIALALGLLSPQLSSAAQPGFFSPTGSMGTPRAGLVAAELPGDRALVAGGANGPPPFLSSAEIFSGATGMFTSTGPMGSPRLGAAASPLADGRVLVVGGTDGVLGVLPSAEIFDPSSGSFSSAGLGALQTKRQDAAAALLSNGEVLIAGGYDGSASLQTAELFNPNTGNFSYTGSMGKVRSGAVAAPLPGGRVLVAGGYNTSDGVLASAEIFDPGTGSFSSAGIGSMVSPRRYAAAAPLPDGRVLIAGGIPSVSGSPLGSAEVFDPATRTFSPVGVGSMGTARQIVAAAPLSDGRVLFAGGIANGPPLASAELYALQQPAIDNSFSFTVRGKKLLVSVKSPGAVAVSDAAAPLGATGAKKRRRLLLAPSGGSGNPPAIVVPLRLTKLARQRLRAKGKVSVHARITFMPQGGTSNGKTTKLKVKGKRPS